MPYCPECHDEFQDWVKICPDCQVALVGELPATSSPTAWAKPAKGSDPLVADFHKPVAEKEVVGVPAQSADGVHTAKSPLVRIRIPAYLLSIGFLAYGWTVGNVAFAVVGACFYLLPLVLLLVDLARSCRVYRATKRVDIDERHPFPGTVGGILNALILFSGLGALCYGAPKFDDRFEDVFAIPGMIIVFGTMLVWLVSGWIIRWVARIPLKSGYGSWYWHTAFGRRQKRSH